jgi:hypothetical protein
LWHQHSRARRNSHYFCTRFSNSNRCRNSAASYYSHADSNPDDTATRFSNGNTSNGNTSKRYIYAAERNQCADSCTTCEPTHSNICATW